MEWMILVGLGALVGLLAGLFGIGGGLVLVPALTLLLPSLELATAEQALPMSIATALVSIIATGLSSASIHIRGKHVDWLWIKRLSVGLFLGGICGALLTSHLPVHWLGIGFGILEIIIAIQMMIGFKPKPQAHHTHIAFNTIFGWLAGTLSAIIGIGGGTITVPWLVWQGIVLPRAIATASILGIIIAVAGTITHLNSDFIQWSIVFALISASLITAPLGATLAHRLPIAQLKSGFSVLLIILGLTMLIKFA